MLVFFYDFIPHSIPLLSDFVEKINDKELCCFLFLIFLLLIFLKPVEQKKNCVPKRFGAAPMAVERATVDRNRMNEHT